MANKISKVKLAVISTVALAVIVATCGLGNKASAIMFPTATNVVYCNGQKLDYYGPRKKVYAKTPLIIFVHGGGLIANNKTSDALQRNFVDPMLDQGWGVASIDYRLLNKSPNQNTTVPIEDTLCAIRFARANAAAAGIDPDRIALWGWSSGGELASLAGTVPADSPLNKGAYLNYSSRPNAVVLLAGMYDVPYEYAHPSSKAHADRNNSLKPYMAGMSKPENQAYSQLSADDPPLYLIHGTRDTAVDMIQTDRMVAKANEVGARYQVLKVQNGDHGLGPNNNTLVPTQTQVNTSIATFLNNTLKPGQ